MIGLTLLIALKIGLDVLAHAKLNKLGVEVGLLNGQKPRTEA